MNERIQELAQQAGMVLYPTGLGGIQENTIWGDRNVEKFAELIVQECCQMMLDLEVKYPANLTVREIKQHFGVEE